MLCLTWESLDHSQTPQSNHRSKSKSDSKTFTIPPIAGQRRKQAKMLKRAKPRRPKAVSRPSRPLICQPHQMRWCEARKGCNKLRHKSMKWRTSWGSNWEFSIKSLTETLYQRLSSDLSNAGLSWTQDERRKGVGTWCDDLPVGLVWLQWIHHRC